MIDESPPLSKVLIIEDNPLLRETMLDILHIEGFEVRGAENGRLGVEIATEFRPDLIVCDIMMPEMDGYEVLEKLHRDPTQTTTPFIFVTAKTDRADVRLGMELGAFDYLTKPFTTEELVASIRTQLAKSQSYNQLAQRKLAEFRNRITLSLPHELRTPLTVILGYTEMLLEDYRNTAPAPLLDMLSSIHKSGLRLWRLVENYLTYAQLEVMRLQPEQQAAMRGNSLQTPDYLIAAEAERKAAEANRSQDLSLDLRNSPSEVCISENYLKKIVNELVDNAFKFSQAGTPVRVATDVQDNVFVLVVEDKGRGMTHDEINNVSAYMQFRRELFEQQGIGLGLAITKMLVELHGGRLHIESAPAQYTSVYVLLPITTG